MMGKRLLWLVGGELEATYDARLTDVLAADHHLNSDMLTVYDTTRARLQSLGHSCVTLRDILRAVDFSIWDDQELVETANGLLAKLDINMLLYSDATLYLFADRGVAQTFIARAIVAIHAFLSQGDYAGLLRYGGGGAIGRATSMVAESLGLPSYTLCHCADVKACGLSPVGFEEQWQWTSFPRCWQIWQSRTVSESDRERIDRYITSYCEWHKALPRTRLEQTMPQAFRQPDRWERFRNRVISLRRPGRWERLKNRIMIWRQGGPSEESTQVISDSILDNLGALSRLMESYFYRLHSQWVESYPKFNYDQIPDRYVYMPLNDLWDVPHRAWNPMNCMQDYLVRIAAASLPCGYQLVIKEHPYALGEPSHKKLQELQEIGVKVVDPHTHSLELIENAEAVFCVGDTTGWEAILFKVPVIVFGARPFYVEYPYLWTVTDPNRVHHALREAVKSEHTAYSDENLWYAFIQSVLESSYPGNIFGYKQTVWADADESEENLRNIANMIAKEGGF